jgi:hypothetical protein
VARGGEAEVAAGDKRRASGMALPLVGDDFRRSQDAKGFHRCR